MESAYWYCPDSQFLEILRRNIAEGNYIYVSELLGRAHQATHLSILRQSRWMNGVEMGLVDGNLFVFASALRGFVEGAGDSFDFLKAVAPSLKEHFHGFRAALGKRVSSGIVCSEEFENLLIHFKHAHKVPKGTVEPITHSAQQAARYVSHLDLDGSSQAKELYSELCQITHPADNSVLCFLKWDAATSAETWDLSHEAEIIQGLIVKHWDAIEKSVRIVFNSALLTLFTLNYFDDIRFNTPAIETVDLSFISGFMSYKLEMEKLKAQPSLSPIIPSS